MSKSKLNGATPAIIDVVINKAIHTLTLTGCKFAIIMPDGVSKRGDLEIAKEKTRTRKVDPSLPSPSAHFKPYLKDLKPGEVASVPIPNDIPVTRLASAMTAFASSTWGKGSYQSCLSKDKQHYELMRTG